ncbi:MAG: hypothetical protein EOO09_10085 [Chitinophagaceae bacterium]|nr:MAG: hypothetical protein EOO09_10085 [Chitinophagaceae bacterium]
MNYRPFTLSFLLLSTLYSFAQPDSTTVMDYLRVNNETLDPGSAKTPVLFDGDFYEQQLFLFGETHGSAEPHSVDIYLFKILYAKAGVRNYIAEVDDTKAWMLNSYLEDGKEEWLKKVFASWIRDTAQWASQENFNKYRELRKFYQSLPATGKFRIIGIDLTQDYSLLKEHLAWILAQSKPVKGAMYVDTLKQMVDTITASGRRELAGFSRRFLGQLSQNMRLAGTTGKNHKQFLHLLRSFSFVEKGVTRDSILYQNFVDYVEGYDIPDEKFYGLLGYFHCLTAGFNKVPTFASLLQSSSDTFSGKIRTMVMQASSGKMMLPLTAQLKMVMPRVVIEKALRSDPVYADGRYIPYDLSNDQPMMMIKGVEYLKRFSEPKGITLFRLNAAGSPYAAGKLSAEVSGFQTLKFTDPGAVTTDAFSYILFFRDAHACTPLPR